MTAQKLVREVIRYEINTHDLARLLDLPARVNIDSITFHDGVLRIFTTTNQGITDYSQEGESQNDDQASIPK